MAKWHSFPLKEIMKQLETSEKGLKKEEITKRYKKYGPNEIKLGKKISPLKIFIEQFADFLIIILIIAAIVAYAIGFFPGQESHIIDSILILTIVLLNGIFGFVQDYKAERSLLALRKLAASRAIVIRDGQREEVNASELVPGDIILLMEGNKIPADARIIDSNDLDVDESILTGESMGVKKENCILKEDIPLAERKNMIYTDTIINRGNAKAVVVSIGMATEVGKIASQIHKTEEKPTIFQKEMNRLGKGIGIAILAIIAFIATIQFLAGISKPVDIFLTSISLAVAAIPEGLPAVVTLALAFGTKVMVKRHSLVRKLPVIEELGSVDVICTDKTGTLTENKMTVRKIWFDNKEIDVTGVGYSAESKFLMQEKEIEPRSIAPLLRVGLLCNNTIIGHDNTKETYVGDPTEIALIISAKKANIKREGYVRIDEISFSSERKRMTTIHKKDKHVVAFTKGAPEIILQKCNKIYLNGKERVLTDKKKKEILAVTEKFASNALRILGFAYKTLDTDYPKIKGRANPEKIESKMVFLGLQGMIDPPRKEVPHAIKMCEKAGIRVVMVTGDNKNTAQAIAQEVGLFKKGVVEGLDIDKFSDDELKQVVEETDIFARVAPIHKVRILKALQENGYIVAITGDGVNDAPAIKAADVGIAMGIRGTDIAREASDMILLDDNFATITEAVKQGRTIFNNIRKFVNYLLTSNFAEVFVVFFASLVGYLPITAVQLLWINLLTDGPPAVALGVDPPTSGIMEKPPRPKKEGVINKRLALLIGVIGIKKTVVLLVLFFITLPQGIEIARTMAFTGFVLYEFVRIGVIRQQEKLNFFSNKWLLGAIALSLALQLTVIYSPLNLFFRTVPLGIFNWLILLTGVGVGWISAIIITKVIIKFTD